MEESPMPTNVPAGFNLQSWATIAVAAALWNKSRVTWFFYSNYAGVTDDYIRLMVKKNEKSFHSLPRKIANQILCTFKSMGQRIALWCDYADFLGIPRNITVTPEWTVYGTIDERKILQNCLDEKIIGHKNSKQMQAAYYAACSNVCVDYITLHWDKMLDFCNEYKLQRSSQFETVNKFIICSVIFLAKLEYSQLPQAQIRYFNDFNYNQKRNIFMLSVEEGCPQAARYYWGLLSAEDKKDLIIHAAILSLDCYRKKKEYDCFEHEDIMWVASSPECNINFARYKSNCFANLLIFLIILMSEDEISEFFDYLNQRVETYAREKSTETVFNALIYHWPLEEFLPLAYNVALKSCKKATDCTQLVEKLLKAMDRSKNLGLCNKQKFYQKLFKAFWNQLRKYSTFEEILSPDRHLLFSIYELFDLEVLKFVIDNCEGNHRKTIVRYGRNVFKYLSKKEEFELLDKFINDVLRFEDERKLFRDARYKCIKLLISQLRFDEVKTFLGVKNSRVHFLNEEQKRIRNQKFAISVCEHLLRTNQTEVADAGLNLIFHSEEEKQNYIKNVLVEKSSCVDSVRESKKIDFVDCIPMFFRWLLNCEDKASRIQKQKLMCQSSLMNLVALLLESTMEDPEVYKIVDEFLLFYLSPKKVTVLKRNIRKKLIKWGGFLPEDVFFRADDFLNWIL